MATPMRMPTPAPTATTITQTREPVLVPVLAEQQLQQ
jgi:hypothetical protein